ncbi:MAG TPA: DUF4410 domain-containing protein [Blastocatellia bacterium]|nr:DUF4410 domain-containing protein [Blastocatellia bacterium]
MMFRNKKIIAWLPLLIAFGAGLPIAAQTNSGKLLAEYESIIVKEVALEKNPKLTKFPAGHDTDFQKKIVADLQRKKVFTRVIDGTRQAGEQDQIAASLTADIPASGKRLILSTTIIDFHPGNKALRYAIGWGMGATRVKARFVFRDAATDQEIWVHTQQGKFLGFITLHGTGKDYPVTEASGDIVDGLIRAINKNR